MLRAFCRRGVKFQKREPGRAPEKVRTTVNKTIIKRLGNLLSVKALVTLTLTAVFACMAAAGSISQDFMTVYTVVIAFYFGTQSQKVQDAVEGGNNGGG